MLHEHLSIWDHPTNIFKQRGPEKTVSSTYKAVNSALITQQPFEKRLLLADQESSVSIQINNERKFPLSVFVLIAGMNYVWYSNFSVEASLPLQWY
jgi:hypothetical protein